MAALANAAGRLPRCGSRIERRKVLQGAHELRTRFDARKADARVKGRASHTADGRFRTRRDVECLEWRSGKNGVFAQRTLCTTREEEVRHARSNGCPKESASIVWRRFERDSKLRARTNLAVGSLAILRFRDHDFPLLTESRSAPSPMLLSIPPFETSCAASTVWITLAI
jgi:hypothetical protein